MRFLHSSTNFRGVKVKHSFLQKQLLFWSQFYSTVTGQTWSTHGFWWNCFINVLYVTYWFIFSPYVRFLLLLNKRNYVIETDAIICQIYISPSLTCTCHLTLAFSQQRTSIHPLSATCHFLLKTWKLPPGEVAQQWSMRECWHYFKLNWPGWCLNRPCRQRAVGELGQKRFLAQRIWLDYWNPGKSSFLDDWRWGVTIPKLKQSFSSQQSNTNVRHR